VITIEHTHAEGTLLHGTARGDGTGAVIKPLCDGWRFSRNIGTDGAWYLPHSRDWPADRSVIDRLAAALRATGYEVEVAIDDAPRAAADIEADRAERVAGRVDRYGGLADARHASGGARLAHVRGRRSHLALGQPVISQRYANFLQRLNRTEESARAEIATGDHWRGRAEAAASNQSYRHDPRVITRRIERLEAEQRRWQRARDGASSDYLARADAEIAQLGDAIDYWRVELAELDATGTYRPWTREHFRVGDEVRILGTWYPVLRVNKKSVTVPPKIFGGQRRLNDEGKDVWTDTAPYDKVYGRRRDGKILHTPPPAEGATCTCRITIPTFNAEFIPEHDGGPCTEPPVARLTIRHDGTSCGCHGTCMIGDPDEPDPGQGQPWTEIVLLCAGHAHEYQADIAASVGTTAATVEDLS
jgi:uncharacterized protein DUF3560